MSIDKAKWLEFDRARIATGTGQVPLDEEALRADRGRHIALINQNGRSQEGVRER